MEHGPLLEVCDRLYNIDRGIIHQNETRALLEGSRVRQRVEVYCFSGSDIMFLLNLDRTYSMIQTIIPKACAVA